MPVGVPKIPYDIPDDDEDEEATWVDLQCDLADLLGHMGFPPSLPDQEILYFAEKKMNQIIKNLEREVQFDPFFKGSQSTIINFNNLWVARLD